MITASPAGNPYSGLPQRVDLKHNAYRPANTPDKTQNQAGINTAAKTVTNDKTPQINIVTGANESARRETIQTHTPRERHPNEQKLFSTDEARTAETVNFDTQNNAATQTFISIREFSSEPALIDLYV